MPLKGQKQSIYSIAISENGNYVVSGSTEKVGLFTILILVVNSLFFLIVWMCVFCEPCNSFDVYMYWVDIVELPSISAYINSYQYVLVCMKFLAELLFTC